MSVLHLLHGWSERSTSSADNIYRHLPVLHHRHLRLYYYVRHQLLIHHLRHSFLRITHMDYIYTTDYSTTADYSRSRTTNYNIICHCLTCPWPYWFMNCFTSA